MSPKPQSPAQTPEKPAITWRPSVFEFLDYRAFLKAYYDAAKQNQSGFSHRYLARRAGFASPNFLKLVMDGRRNLSTDSIEQVAQALKLDGEEELFFAQLVAFNQAETDAERNRRFERLTANRRFREAQQLQGQLFEYLSHWYYPAIREMAARADFREDSAWIASQLLPTIKPAQAAQALEALLHLGLLVRDENGAIRRGETTVTSGHEVRALAVSNYHRQMLDRASQSIEAVPSDRRDLSAMTVCVTEALVPELKRRLREFREALMDVCDRESDPEVVYQMNIQLFPLSRSRGDEK